MLESLVANVLNRFLGAYVTNLNVNQLNIAIWTGEVVLRNLQLKKEALDKFNMPVDVAEGFLGELVMSIPWSNLRSKPVRITIKDIYLLAIPRAGSKFDAEEGDQRAQKLKQERLENWELLGKEPAKSQEEDHANASFVNQLVTKIIDNLQISIMNIHIRYEDNLSTPGHPFSVGITLSELSAVSTDEDWRPMYIEEPSNTIHKLVTLGSLAVYWNTDSRSIANLPLREALQEFVQLIAMSDEVPEEHQYVLKPVSGIGKLKLNKRFDSNMPKTEGTLLFEELGFILDDDQYRDALMLASLFHRYVRQSAFLKFRPSSTPKADPKAWLQFAGNCILSEIHERNRKWTWNYLKERRDDRKMYLELYINLKLGRITPEEIEQLDQIERKWSYEDIRFFRSLAKPRLKKEQARLAKTREREQKRSQSWFGWIFGGSQSTSESQESENLLTEDQMKELCDAIEYDEKEAASNAMTLSDDVILFALKTKLKTGSFVLRRYPHSQNIDLLSLVFDNLSADVLQRQGSLLAKIALGDLSLYDGVTSNSVYPKLIRVKEPVARTSETEHVCSHDDSLEDAFFSIMFESNPLDHHADNVLSVRMRHMEMIYNADTIRAIKHFFIRPTSDMETINALLEVAGDRLQDIRQQTRSGLEYALLQHRTLDLRVDMDAPIIIIPEDPTDESGLVAVLNIGHIDIKSDLVAKRNIEDMQKKHGQALSEEDFAHLESLMYDKFNVKLSSMQFIIGRSIEEYIHETASLIVDSDSVIERVNMSFLVAMSILPQAPNLTRFRVSGHLPIFQANLSDRKYREIMKLIDVIISKTLSEDSPETPVGMSSAQSPGSAIDEDLKLRMADKLGLAKDKGALLELESGSEEDEEYSQASTSKAREQRKQSSIMHPGVQSSQKLFEFSFTITKFSASLRQSIESGEENPLIDIVLDRLSIGFIQRPFDMSLQVTLKDLAITDRMEHGIEFGYLVTSQPVEENSADDGKALVEVSYVQSSSDSPDYAGYSQTLNISMSTLSLIFTRSSILTLNDFLLSTFIPSLPGGGNRNGEESTKDSVVIMPAQINSSKEDSGMIKIDAHLTSISIILNDNGDRLATAALSQVSLFVSMTKVLKVRAKIGAFTIEDDTDDVSPPLLSFEDEELADFRYETFESGAGTSNDFDSSVYLRAGAAHMLFSEYPLRRIFQFMNQFVAMKSVYDAARERATQSAKQLQKTDLSRIHFDITWRAPTIFFTKEVKYIPGANVVIANLGELRVLNESIKSNKDETRTLDHITIGLNHIRLTSEFSDDANVESEHSVPYKQILNIIEDVDVNFDIVYGEHVNGSNRPDIEINGKLSEIRMGLTEEQYIFLIELGNSVSSTFVVADQGESQRLSKSLDENSQVAELPDFRTPQHLLDEGVWTKIDLVFNAPNITLELFSNVQSDRDQTLSKRGLCRLSLFKTDLKLKMLSDSSLASEIQIASLTVFDTRAQPENKFREIIPAVQHGGPQFMASFSMASPPQPDIILLVTVDSPRILFSLEYLFALRNYLMAPFVQSSKSQDESRDAQLARRHSQALATTDAARAPYQKPQMAAFHYRINIVDPEIILLDNPSDLSSDAFVLSAHQIVLSQQSIMALAAVRIGMFLCRMDSRAESSISLIENFDVSMSAENRVSHAQITTISADIQPLLLRLSFRDIMLITDIINKATELSTTAGGRESRGSLIADTESAQKPQPQLELPESARIDNNVPYVAMTREMMKAKFEGFRLVLIGDIHNIPMVDAVVNPFTVEMSDWSNSLLCNVSLQSHINFFNVKNSHWEPLLEPWNVSLRVSRPLSCSHFNVEISSKKRMEVNISHTMVETALRHSAQLKQKRDARGRIARTTLAPYLIRNRTGYPIVVWKAPSEKEIETAANSHELKDGDDMQWEFDDWRSRRETIAVRKNTLCVQVKGFNWESLKDIPLDCEGEQHFTLRPQLHGISHRIMCEIRIKKRIKLVTFRSTLVVRNNTNLTVDMMIADEASNTMSQVYHIAPGKDYPVPIETAYSGRIRIRPSASFGYDWCTQLLFWRDFTTKGAVKIISCPGTKREDAPFCFQVFGKYDSSNRLSSRYPFMAICLSAPIEIENLLPYDINMRVIDKTTKHDFNSDLTQGRISPLHVVELNHLILLSVKVIGTDYLQSDFAIISISPSDDLNLDDILTMEGPNGFKLNLGIQYHEIPDSGGSRRISIYSPYVLFNKTGLDITFKIKSFLQSRSSGYITSEKSGDGNYPPLLFSYPKKDRRNRVLIRVGESEWSQPLSFEAVGTDIEQSILVPSSKEAHLGVSVIDGIGKYKLTRVVTISPRFILKNNLREGLQFRELGSTSKTLIKSHEHMPFLLNRQNTDRIQLELQFDGSNDQWSAPFPIQELGKIHIKMRRNEHAKYELIRCDILLEGATVFIVFNWERGRWPYRIENNSDIEVTFYQHDSTIPSDKLHRFTLRPGGKTVYSWDYPASKSKNLLLNVDGRERTVNFQEIGALPPFRCSNTRILSIDVAADGPTQVLRLSNYSPQSSLYRPKAHGSLYSLSSRDTSSREQFEVVNVNSVVNLNVKIHFTGVGFSIVNKHVQELLYASISDLEIKYSDSTMYQSVEVKARWLQVDNQLYGGLYPIVLYPSLLSQSSQEVEQHPTLHAVVMRVKDESHGVLFLKYCTILLQELTFEIDEDFLFALLDFTKFDLPGWNDPGDQMWLEISRIPEPTAIENTSQLYFEMLHIQPIKLNLSFMRTNRTNGEEDRSGSHNPIKFLLNVLTMAIGNINYAPVRLNALILENVRVTAPELTDRITRHYSQDVLIQLYKVVGSADFLGNPIGLFNNISSGVAAIFYEPYQGFIMSDRPQDLGIGIAKGTASFFKKTIYGVSDSLSKFTGSVGKGLSAATLDKDYQERRRLSLVRNKPRHAIYGVTEGANRFMSSVSSGFAGIVQKPLEGAESEGFGGLIKGVGRGLVGAVTKPIVGVFDLASGVSEGIRNTTTVFDVNDIDRMRLPRHIGHDGVLRPYSQREALGLMWLKEIENGQYANEDYIAHCSVYSDEKIAMLTDKRILLIITRRLVVEWQKSFAEIDEVSTEDTGIRIKLLAGFGRERSVFITITQSSIRNWFYRKIVEVIRRYNAGNRSEIM
ncbi:uncharacterized protein VTP21DRAFT_11379 [Calcarisporiella thermophila]|uniref:uncharacterized protein n=1 Tax=Calcarisporiella thermophila TaxID=911321 RepID=UPI0037444C9E